MLPLDKCLIALLIAVNTHKRPSVSQLVTLTIRTAEINHQSHESTLKFLIVVKVTSPRKHNT